MLRGDLRKARKNTKRSAGGQRIARTEANGSGAFRSVLNFASDKQFFSCAAISRDALEDKRIFSVIPGIECAVFAYARRESGGFALGLVKLFGNYGKEMGCFSEFPSGQPRLGRGFGNFGNQ